MRVLRPAKRTTRKFYKKWVYKVSIRVTNVAIFRRLGFNVDEGTIYSYLAGKENTRMPYAEWGWGSFGSHSKNRYLTKEDNAHELAKLAGILQQFPDSEWQKRFELACCVDIYTSNYKLYEMLGKHMARYVQDRYEPANGTQDILENPKHIAVDHLPYGKYEYKANLNVRPLVKDPESRENLANWLKEQYPNVSCTDSVATWLRDGNIYASGRYVLVKDEATLLMLKLRAGSTVSSVYKYIKVDKVCH